MFPFLALALAYYEKFSALILHLYVWRVVYTPHTPKNAIQLSRWEWKGNKVHQ